MWFLDPRQTDGLAGCPFLFSKRNEPMKRPILTVAIMLATSTPVFAQNTEREKQRWLP
jgi:hypothetical protein